MISLSSTTTPLFFVSQLTSKPVGLSACPTEGGNKGKPKGPILNFGVYLGENCLSKIMGLAWNEGEIRFEVDKIFYDIRIPWSCGLMRHVLIWEVECSNLAAAGYH